MSIKSKKYLRIALVLVCGVVLLVVVGWVFAPAFLVIDSGAEPGDAVVVLGGESWTRPTRGAEVYQETKELREKLKAEPSNSETTKSENTVPNSQLSDPSISNLPARLFVIVSGSGDCQDVRRQMEARGVPASAIETECESRSTWENALFSAKLLRAHHATNVVLVTSWFHSRRALACFRKAAPEITFSSRPTVKPPGESWWPEKYERKRITQEYLKILYYQIFHGVSSW